MESLLIGVKGGGEYAAKTSETPGFYAKGNITIPLQIV
jgi:hypothetical protein